MFLSFDVARHFQIGPNCSVEAFDQLSFDILDAYDRRGEEASGMGCPTKQSFYNKSILTFAKTGVCSLVYMCVV